MTEQSSTEDTTRGGDRRGGDRRRTDRRTPAPLWRRPWAFAAYGVLGALVVVLLIQSGDDAGEEGAGTGEVLTTTAPPPVDPRAPASAGAATVDAYSVGEFERLLAEGAGAAGQRVRTELYCQAVEPVALRDVDAVNRAVAALADADRRVPAAECRWGSSPTAPNFLLVVPPDLTPAFAASPEVMQDFVRRRRVRAELEWVGRSDALALRNVGVLRRVGG